VNKSGAGEVECSAQTLTILRNHSGEFTPRNRSSSALNGNCLLTPPPFPRAPGVRKVREGVLWKTRMLLGMALPQWQWIAPPPLPPILTRAGSFPLCLFPCNVAGVGSGQPLHLTSSLPPATATQAEHGARIWRWPLVVEPQGGSGSDGFPSLC
jgi:hypothetical protein